MPDSTSVTWKKWEKWVIRETERFLTWRKRRKLARKARQKKRNPIVDWLDAILSAVVIVLLINQYLLQAYQIPSPSMEPSLLVSDRIFVNKIVYGPELIPGMLKLPGIRSPARGNVVIFESPEYISSGPLMDVLQRVVYMVTLSLVDIDKDENGQPKHHFLIKRAIGMPGDRIRMNKGDVEILAPGESTWLSEAEMKKALGFNYSNVRTFKPEDYPVFREAGIGKALMDAGLEASAEQSAAINQYYQANKDANGKVTSFMLRALDDDIYVTLWEDATLWAIEPNNFAKAAEWRMLTEGYPVPEGRIFPMGDNRDNSHDARYFGPVRLEKVLGKGLFRYWPIYRFGAVK
ncbi:MAG: signal peptidase I [Spirochaetia bacterium]|jgi:signal peptidase I